MKRQRMLRLYCLKRHQVRHGTACSIALPLNPFDPPDPFKTYIFSIFFSPQCFPSLHFKTDQYLTRINNAFHHQLTPVANPLQLPINSDQYSQLAIPGI
jgi:hypothetical protein